MIGKVIVSAQTREEALAKMERALSEYVIEGIHTSIPFHLQLLQNEKFRAGDFTTKFMEDFELKKP
jgi:acetyl-CoA carboxylase biotin carboxylase subunit